MEILTAVLGAATVILGLVLSAITLANRVVRGLKGNVREVLVEEGIVRPGSSSASWPNDWHSLPDTLQGIYEKQGELETEIHKLGESSRG